MKKRSVATILLLVSVFSLAFGQVSKTKVSIDIPSETLDKAIELLRKKSGVNFLYTSDELSKYRTSAVQFKNQNIGEVLKQLTKGTNLEFVERNNAILIRTRAISNSPVTKKTGNTAAQQEVTVQGTLVDNTGLKLEGVTVQAREVPSIKTRTDQNGMFILKLTKDVEHLTFSLVGFQSTTLAINEIKEDDLITLNIDQGELEEVVVVGFGTQKKQSLVGSQSTIKPQELKVPVANLSTAIAGRLAGVVATQRGGGPGSGGADLFVRGVATFSSSPQNPLLVVDGVPDRSIDNIDPEDVESFTVLKDATATAVYGTRGANGVIIINTRKGRSGRATITAEANQGITGFTYLPKFVDGPTNMRLYNEGMEMRDRQPYYTEEVIAKHISGEDPDLYPNVNWYDVLFNDFGTNNRVNLNINGGADIAKYFVSLGYYGETGQFKTGDVEAYNSKLKQDRFNFTSNTNINLTKSTTVDFGLSGYISTLNRPAYGINELFVMAASTAPHVIPVQYSNGQWPQIKGLLPSPYMALTQSGVNNRYDNSIRSNLKVVQDLGFLTQGLKASGLFAFDINSQNNLNRGRNLQTYFATGRDDDGNLITEISSTGSNDLSYSLTRFGDRRFYSEGSLNYGRSFNNHEVGGLILFNQSDYSDATSRVDNYTKAIPYRQRNLVGRGTYGYDGRYFAEANFSYSGSDNFAPANRFGFFPSVGLGWLVSNEKFFEGVSNHVSHLKLRYSYGVSGNAGVNDPNNRFLYLSRFAKESGGYAFGEPGASKEYKGYYEDQIGANVRWESSYRHNLGIEINFFQNELQFIAELFKEDRQGILMRDLSIPYNSGYTSSNLPFLNIGETSNKGIDVTLEYNKKFGDQGFVMTRGTFNYNKNNVVRDNLPAWRYPWLEREGHKISQRFGYVAEGLFKSDEEIASSAKQTGDVRVGDIRYRDLNGDGMINSDDQQAIGYGSTPAVMYGLTIAAGYKGFDMSLFFQGAGMVDINMGSGFGTTPFPNGRTYGNLYEAMLDRWDPNSPDKKTLYPRLSTSADQTTNYYTSSWWLKKGDYLRLKQVEIGYNFTSQNFLKKLSISKMRVFTNGTNLFTLSSWDLWDPEVGDGRGVSYPNTRVFNFGVRVNFQ
ncbi:TonB-linked SusC/RagA family outer membrane protein [Sphingobacterium yanglingense]|uniref:TonB-linked SusC/RagA family outer membrane protein n=2 Tax=Sphingobacterium yanglingense TaxID=1437280 RepID=A0A4R6W9N8_9SPHI|nr:TonB-linked SusC/RagA family outer membrane protein [Sphingobacterium yanglingense]